MKINYFIFLQTCFFCLICFTAEAQQFHFQKFSLEQGLPQSEVKDMEFEAGGAMWASTNGGGLVRFNGKEMRVFSEKDGLPGKVCADLEIDGYGRVWVGGSKGVARLLPNGKFKSWTPADGLTVATDDYGLTVGAIDVGKMWIVSHDKNRETSVQVVVNDKLQSAGEEFEIFRKPESMLFQVIPDKLNKLMYFTSLAGMYVWNGKTLKRSPMNDMESLKDGIIIIVNIKDGGKMTFRHFKSFNPQAAADVYDYDPEAVIPLQKKENFGFGGGDTETDEDGGVWINSNKGIKYYTGGSTRIFDGSNGFTDKSISTIEKDSEGNIWIGSLGSGFFRFSGQAFVKYSEPEGLASPVVFSIYEDKKGRLYVGSNNGNLAVREPDSQVFTNYHLDIPSPVFEIKEWNGKIYLVVAGGMYSFENGKFSLAAPDFNLNTPEGKTIGTGIIEPGPKGELWVSAFNHGIYKIKGKDTVNIKTTDGLVSNNVRCLFAAKNGTFYAGTADGLSIIENDKVVKTYTSQNGLRENLILDFAEDRFGRVWAAAHSGGLLLFDRSKLLKIYDQSNTGLQSELIYSVLADSEQNIWVGTHKGISKLIFDQSGKIVDVLNLGKQEGFTAEECNRKAAFADSKGMLWFGTIEGLFRFNPKVTLKKHRPAPVQIRGVRLFFRETDWTAKKYDKFTDGKTDSLTGLPTELILPYDSNHISFDFEAATLSVPEKVKFKWKLENVDRMISPVSDRMTAEYPDLRPGTYTFKVWASNSAGKWNPEPATFTFTIEPPFWETAGFRIFALLALVGLIYLGFRIKLVHERKSKERLERLVQQKTSEVVQKNTELEQQQEEILSQNQFISRQNGELSSKNKAITDSINYAKRIQYAMLPGLEKIRAALPESFVFFRPRDIVSGDFYWFSDTGTHLIFIVADCTGHGVPGAFMSLTGNAYLNQIVETQGITSPAEILEKLDTELRKSLTNSTEGKRRDGMEAAVNVIDKAAKTLTFAGAGLPLVMFKNGEMHSFKGDKKAAGGALAATDFKFTEHQIDLSEAAITFYTFSDGFQDQFGGPNDRKFMRRRLNELLAKIQQENTETQQARIKEAFENWKGEGRQIDDVLLVGFRTEPELFS